MALVCHSERSEESRSWDRKETLRFAQGDRVEVLLECLNEIHDPRMCLLLAHEI